MMMRNYARFLPTMFSQPPDPRVRPLIDTVLFDLGGVLVDWNPRHLYRQVFADHQAMETFLAEICSPAWNARQDAGRPWDEAIAELSARHPEHAEYIALYRDRWHEMLGGAMEETVAVLARLRAEGLRLYALTNWSHETFPMARERYEFLSWFEGILVSGEEKLIKPDPAIFALTCQRFALVPARTLFIDDSSVNVAAARALGLHALQFHDAARLEADLREFALVPPGASS